MTWEKVRFGDLYSIESRNGLTKPSRVRGSGYKMINMGELFSNDKIYDIPMEYVPLSEREKLNFKVEKGDLLFARQSLVLEGAGKCSIVMEVSPLTVFESHLIRVRLTPEEANPVFYYYYFKSPASPIKTIVSQCAQAGIRGSDLQELTVSKPPLFVQNKIASHLSAYDDLIENNKKQIKLLEEAAQRLYKEWFVDLRFPGHENVPVVDGVPTGWERCKFSEKVAIMSGGTPSTGNKSFYQGDIPFYTPKDYKGDFFSFETDLHISEEGLNSCNSAYYPTNTIIITARGTVGKTVLLGSPMAMNQSCYALKSDVLNSPYYLFFALRQEVEKLKTMANGGVFDTIIIKTFDSISLMIPTKEILAIFERSINAIMDDIKNKQKISKLLTEARDRILPKLMSGVIEV